MSKTDLLIFSLFAISIKRNLVIIVKCQHDPFIVLTTFIPFGDRKCTQSVTAGSIAFFKNIPTVGKLHYNTLNQTVIIPKMSTTEQLLNMIV